MLDKIIKVLSYYQYQVKYTSYHKKNDIIKHKKREKNINEDKLLTILTKDKLVIGRIHDLKKNSPFTKKHLEKIIAMFNMFQLSHREKIIEELKKISNKSI